MAKKNVTSKVVTAELKANLRQLLTPIQNKWLNVTEFLEVVTQCFGKGYTKKLGKVLSAELVKLDSDTNSGQLRVRGGFGTSIMIRLYSSDELGPHRTLNLGLEPDGWILPELAPEGACPADLPRAKVRTHTSLKAAMEAIDGVLLAAHEIERKVSDAWPNLFADMINAKIVKLVDFELKKDPAVAVSVAVERNEPHLSNRGSFNIVVHTPDRTSVTPFSVEESGKVRFKRAYERKPQLDLMLVSGYEEALKEYNGTLRTLHSTLSTAPRIWAPEVAEPVNTIIRNLAAHELTAEGNASVLVGVLHSESLDNPAHKIPTGTFCIRTSTSKDIKDTNFWVNVQGEVLCGDTKAIAPEALEKEQARTKIDMVEDVTKLLNVALGEMETCQALSRLLPAEAHGSILEFVHWLKANLSQYGDTQSATYTFNTQHPKWYVSGETSTATFDAVFEVRGKDIRVLDSGLKQRGAAQNPPDDKVFTLAGMGRREQRNAVFNGKAVFNVGLTQRDALSALSQFLPDNVVKHARGVLTELFGSMDQHGEKGIVTVTFFTTEGVDWLVIIESESAILKAQLGLSDVAPELLVGKRTVQLKREAQLHINQMLGSQHAINKLREAIEIYAISGDHSIAIGDAVSKAMGECNHNEFCRAFALKMDTVSGRIELYLFSISDHIHLGSFGQVNGRLTNFEPVRRFSRVGMSRPQTAYATTAAMPSPDLSRLGAAGPVKHLHPASAPHQTLRLTNALPGVLLSVLRSVLEVEVADFQYEQIDHFVAAMFTNDESVLFNLVLENVISVEAVRHAETGVGQSVGLISLNLH